MYLHHPCMSLSSSWQGWSMCTKCRASVFSEGTNSGACRELQIDHDRSTMQDQGLATEVVWPCLSWIHLIHYVKTLKRVQVSVVPRGILYLKESAFASHDIFQDLEHLCHFQKSESCIGARFMKPRKPGNLNSASNSTCFHQASHAKVCWNSSVGIKHRKTWKNIEKTRGARTPWSFSEIIDQVPPRASGSGPILVSLPSTLVLFNGKAFAVAVRSTFVSKFCNP